MIEFSFSDIGRMLKRGKGIICLMGLFCALLAFFYLLTRPIHFTAEGIFKGATPPSQNPLFKALEFLGMDDHYSSSDDPRSFLLSYPVMEETAKSLRLQATLSEGEFGHRFKEIWYTLKTALAYHQLKQERPPSAIAHKQVLVPDQIIVPDFTPSIICSELDYPAEIASTLTIRFISDKTFKVKEKGRQIGEGTLDAPFRWQNGSLTLTGQAKAGKSLSIYLMPLQQAVKSLQKSIRISRDKENPSLVHLRYTHRNRQLAAQIVNGVMEQFENYLTLDGKRKIAKQLSYLHQRQEETLAQLETVLQKQKTYLEAHLDAGIILSLEKELEFMADTQAQRRQRLIALQSEMQHLAPDKTLSQCLADYAGNAQSTHALSVESAHDMISYHQKELDQLCLDYERFEDCIVKLSEPGFDCSSLSKILADPSLQSRFEKMHTLHHRLIDEKNWSNKERELLRTELETEKVFMKEHTQLLKEGIVVHMQSIQKRIEALHQDLLYLLADRYIQEEKALVSLRDYVHDFPEKWLNEQKITLTGKLYKEIMESITKMIEAKNLGYNLDYLLSQVIQPAFPPVIPDSTHLLLGSGIALGGGICGVILLLCLIAIWQGPSASYHHLSQAGKKVLPQEDTIPLLALALAPQGRVILLTARKEIFCSSALSDWLQRKGEKLFVIDLTQREKGSPYEESAYLATSQFETYLDTLRKEFDRILILATAPITSFQTQALIKQADAIVYAIYDEKLEDLKPLPDKTLFVIQPFEPDGFIPIKHIVPMLEKLLQKRKLSSFSSGPKRAWELLFPLKKT